MTPFPGLPPRPGLPPGLPPRSITGAAAPDPARGKSFPPDPLISAGGSGALRLHRRPEIMVAGERDDSRSRTRSAPTFF